MVTIHEVIEFLRNVDGNHFNQRAKEKAAKALSRQLATQARELEAQKIAEQKREHEREQRARQAHRRET